MKSGRLLIADDNKGVLQALQLFLQFEFEQVVVISNPNILLNEVDKHGIDIVLLDMNFTSGQHTGNEGLFWLGEIKKHHPEIEVVMFTAYGDVSLAVNALKEGAADFILKPWDNEKLIATLRAALRLRSSSQQIATLKSKEKALKNVINEHEGRIIWSSSAMRGIMQLVEKISLTDANILITGENGTGKELIAREIHRLSARRTELLVPVDLSSLTETLFESELFGHKKGAFTNAYEDRPGKFMIADKGTLFLDEIGNIPMHLQSKLLSVLQTRTIIPVGANAPVDIDIRLICATNKDIFQMVGTQTFRQDLLYRINTIQIHLPALRERPDDIPTLVEHYLNVYRRKYGKPTLTISTAAIAKLHTNAWPGNIRELQHTIEKAVILTDNKVLQPEDFILRLPTEDFTNQPETLEEMERKMIVGALVRHEGNLSAIAAKLGISRPTLYHKIKKYGL